MAVLSDPISDFLTRLKNASLAGNEEFHRSLLQHQGGNRPDSAGRRLHLEL